MLLAGMRKITPRSSSVGERDPKKVQSNSLAVNEEEIDLILTSY